VVASRGLYSSIARERKIGCLKQSAGLSNEKDLAQVCEHADAYGCGIVALVTE